MANETGYYDLIRRDVLDLVPEDCSSILDLGGGTGESGVFLKKKTNAQKLTLIDIFDQEPKEGIDSFHCLDINNTSRILEIGEQDGPFDVILCFDVFEHLYEPWDTVAALEGMLSEGGVIVASIPNMRHYHLWFPLIFKGQFELEDNGLRDRTHFRWFTRSSALSLLKSNQMGVELLQPKLYGWKANTLNRLTFRAFEDLLALQFYIRARKKSA